MWIELALEHVEEKTGCTLSREIGTPNIAAKGQVEPRRVRMPRSLVERSSSAKSKSKEKSSEKSSGLIQEVESSSTSAKPNTGTASKPDSKPKSILKNASAKPVGGQSVGKKGSTDMSASATSAGPPLQATAGGGAIANPSPNASTGPRPLIEEIPSHGDDDIQPKQASKQNANASSTSVAAETNRVGTPLIEGIAVAPNTSESASAPEVLSVEEMGRRMRLPPMRWTWVQEGTKVRIEVDVTSLVCLFSFLQSNI